MNDEQLRELLKKWCDMEPSANFQANVHRRIRLATRTPPPQSIWLWRPAFAVALLIGVIVGAWTGRGSADQPRVEMQFMSAGTLAGGYVRLATEARQ